MYVSLKPKKYPEFNFNVFISFHERGIIMALRFILDVIKSSGYNSFTIKGITKIENAEGSQIQTNLS